MRYLSMLLLSLTCPAVATAAEWRVQDCPVDDRRLLAGEIQTCEKTLQISGGGEPGKALMGVVLVNAPYNRVWNVVSDWEAQPAFMPGLKFARERHRFPGGSKTSWHSLVETRLDIPFVAYGYTLDARFDKRVGKISWRMLRPEEISRYQSQDIPVRNADEERFSHVEGYAQISAYDQQRTVYYYAPVLETREALPGFIRSAISSVTLNDHLDAVKKVAELKAKH